MDKDKNKGRNESSIDQARRFTQQEAAEKHRRQAGTDQLQGGSGQAENKGTRQSGGGLQGGFGQSDQQQAENRGTRQVGSGLQGGFGQSGQQQAENSGTRQQGGWSDEDTRREGSKPPSERDRDYDPDGDLSKR